jgi:hypothetical protein
MSTSISQYCSFRHGNIQHGFCRVNYVSSHLSEHPVFSITNTLSFHYEHPVFFLPSRVLNEKVRRNVTFPFCPLIGLQKKLSFNFTSKNLLRYKSNVLRFLQVAVLTIFIIRIKSFDLNSE